MRKLIKSCLVAGSLFLIFGLGVTATSVALGARPQLYEWKTRMDDWRWRDTRHLRDGEASYDVDGLAEEGSARKFEGVEQLTLDIGAGEVYVSEADTGGTVLVQYEDDGEFRCDYDGGELTVKSSRFNLADRWDDPWDEERSLYIYVPRNYRFEQVEVELAAGSVSIDRIYADELELTASAGAIEVLNGDVNRLDVDCEAGGIGYSGRVSGDIEADCKTGGIKLELTGAKRDFDYELSCKIGMIILEDENFSGLAGEKTISNQAGKSMDLDCKTGGIEVRFLD